MSQPIDSLPNLLPRPGNVADHTGKQRGKMTAIAWYRPSRSGKGTVWLCRCECGLFEYRRPGTWESKPHPEDMCDACLRAKGPNFKVTAQVRYQQWIESLRELGLTENEITRITASGSAVETRGASMKIATVLFREALQSVYGPFDWLPLGDGEIHRFHVPGDKPGRLNGWYVLFIDSIATGAFGSWKEGKTHTCCSRCAGDLP